MGKNTTESRHMANEGGNGHRKLTDGSQINKYSWLLDIKKLLDFISNKKNILKLQ